MSRAVYDSSAVDNYISELSKREAEVTRTRQIDNTIKEVPYQVLRWAGRLLPVAILIWILGHAISNALSYERIVKNETISSTNSNSQDSKGALSDDELIDVDSILADADNQATVFPKVDEPDVAAESVRNYYMFDSIPFSGSNFDVVTVGRQYAEKGSAPSEEFCYVNVNKSDGTSTRIDFIYIQEGERFDHELTQEIADNTGVPLSEFKAARSKCTI